MYGGSESGFHICARPIGSQDSTVFEIGGARTLCHRFKWNSGKVALTHRTAQFILPEDRQNGPSTSQVAPPFHAFAQLTMAAISNWPRDLEDETEDTRLRAQLARGAKQVRRIVVSREYLIGSNLKFLTL